ncbi:hypothetical protein NDN08_006649 [Rhodosorus marinus]|uniref:Peroxisomal membrane protein MPV17 n=1 Tax=Rhodosorus marinus TaxID=101924 RepID=A0AAV8UM59_9RHOD|nr:hypothetical protein NDN08_006649 [Rhodosorus marinus]
MYGFINLGVDKSCLRVGGSNVGREIRPRRGSGVAIRRSDLVRVNFEGNPPVPPGGFYDEGEWDEFDEDGDSSWDWNLLALYGKLLARGPLTTKMITGGILTALADYMAQWIEMKDDPEKDLDLRRLASLTAWFTLVGTPLLHGWFGFLERIFPGMVALKAVKQMAIDQLLWAVFFNAQMMFGMTFLETFDVKAALKKIKDQIVTVIIANWKLWPIAQLVNFSVVPLSYRVLFANLVAFVWTLIFTTISHQEEH